MSVGHKWRIPKCEMKYDKRAKCKCRKCTTYRCSSKIDQLSSKEKQRKEGKNEIHRGTDATYKVPFEEKVLKF